MATSIVEIWNFALLELGHDPVNDEDEVSEQADICRAAWPIQRDRMLEHFDWDFARRYVVLTPINDDAELVDGWNYAYEWPQADLIVFRGILNPNYGSVPSTPYVPSPYYPAAYPSYTTKQIPYETMLMNSGTSRKILTDIGDAKGIYTERITDPSRYTPSFTYAMAIAMEAVIIGAIKKDTNDANRAEAKLKAADDYARTVTANQREPRTPGQDTPRSIAARA